MKAYVCLFIASSVLAAGCDKKPHEEPTTEPSAVIVAQSSVNTVGVAPSDSTAVSEEPEINVPEDLADDAAEEITPQNLDKELAALEKEIANDT